ncbi:MAG TPA: hypothetical protein VKA27_00655 [Sunxiuqinia sp.]|nr:hypothetical protein [Sunxiuqinia sp.]
MFSKEFVDILSIGIIIITILSLENVKNEFYEYEFYKNGLILLVKNLSDHTLRNKGKGTMLKWFWITAFFFKPNFTLPVFLIGFENVYILKLLLSGKNRKLRGAGKERK